MGEVLCSLDGKTCWKKRVLANCSDQDTEGIYGYACSKGYYENGYEQPPDDTIPSEWQPEPEEQNACLCS